jgi:hypothetical protein
MPCTPYSQRSRLSFRPPASPDELLALMTEVLDGTLGNAVRTRMGGPLNACRPIPDRPAAVRSV